MKGWRDYLEREGNEASDKPFKILTNLFANDDEAIYNLESIRLNPNLVSENKLRNDLEYYLPFYFGFCCSLFYYPKKY